MRASTSRPTCTWRSTCRPALRPIWQTWREGKFPDIVFEVSSPSTEQADTGRKRALYAQLGAREYYIHDPAGALSPPFQGFHLREGVLEAVPLLPSGGIHSPLLEAELRPIGQWLRVIDPATGTPLRSLAELERDFAELQRNAARRARLDAEQRLDAERRATQAEARLRELLAAMGRREQADNG